MRTKFITAGLAALALAVPASASAATYSGNYETTGTLQFTVSNNKVKDFQFAGFPLNCKGNAETTTDGLNFDVKVKKGHFEASAFKGNDPRKPRAKLKLVGDIDGALASGTMNIKGKKVPIDGGGQRKCRSGNVDWTASAQVKSDSGPAPAAKFARP